ncbi:MAG: NAD+ synthase [Phycisphaerales bacterium]
MSTSIRIALCPINSVVGDIAGNARLIASRLDEARAKKADLIVFPELALCGYPPRDLLLQQGFIEASMREARAIGENLTKGLTAIFGVPLPVDTRTHTHGGPIHNSLLVYANNAMVDYYDKRLLPTYDVFDEDRYFEPGSRNVIVEVSTHAGPSIRVGLAICEDLWKGEDAGFAHRYDDSPDPVAEIAKAGCQLILAPSASPFVLGKSARHREILRAHAKRHAVHVVSLNALGGNDELIFDGHSLAYAPDATLLHAGPIFTDTIEILDLDLRAADERAPARTKSSIHPAAGIDAPDEVLLFHALTLGVRDYLRKTGFTSALIGLSGGIDSALTAAIAVKALGPSHVTGVAMPSHYSSSHSVDDALDLAKRLGITCPVVPIAPPFEGFRHTLDAAFRELHHATLGEKLPDITEENVQSRIRGSILMAISNRTGAMVLTTGNKSELAVGYCTLYGDMNGGLAVLADVRKQQVYALSRWINANHTKLGFTEAPIPECTITKPPSAELRPDQTDQDSLPPYDALDAIIETYVEHKLDARHIVERTGLDAALVSRIVRLIDVSEYKRKQTAVGLKVTTVAFGIGRRHPIAQNWRPDKAL